MLNVIHLQIQTQQRCVVARAVVQVTLLVDTVVQAVPACHVREVAVVRAQATVLIPVAVVPVAVAVAAVPVAVAVAVVAVATAAEAVAVAHEDKMNTSLQCCLESRLLCDL